MIVFRYSRLICLLLVPLSSGWGADAPQLRGLTEPYRTIDVAAVETGVVSEMLVREGDTVGVDQALAKLDIDLLQSLLTIAEHSKEARGRLQAARAEMKLKADRAKRFAEVLSSGHARPEEVRRAETDLEISRGNLLAAEEDLVLKQLEYEKILTQIDRRTVRAPIAGVVSHIHKEQGEFVAPNDPAVLTLVQLDPLLAVFSLTTEQAGRLRVSQEVSIYISERKQPVAALVEFIAPITDAESGLVLVKVRVDNSDGMFRSGIRCTLQLPAQRTAESSLPAKTVQSNSP
ncbi:MAG: efflux RND transporter periplasmic adaptor subunit [Planctomycetota bacterium]